MTVFNLGRVRPSPRGIWNASTTYEALDVVFHEVDSFMAKRTSTGVTPVEDSDDWQVMSRSADASSARVDAGTAAADAASARASATEAETRATASAASAASANTRATTAQEQATASAASAATATQQATASAASAATATQQATTATQQATASAASAATAATRATESATSASTAEAQARAARVAADEAEGVVGPQGAKGDKGDIGGSGRPVDWLLVQDSALSANATLNLLTATGLTQEEIFDYGSVYFLFTGSNGRPDDVMIPLNMGSRTVGQQASTATATLNGTTLSSANGGIMSAVFLVPKGASAALDEEGVVQVVQDETYRLHEFTDLLALGEQTKTVNETSDATNTSAQLFSSPLLPTAVDPAYYANPTGETKIILSEFLATYTGSGFAPRITRLQYFNEGSTVQFDSGPISLVVGETNTDGIELPLVVNIRPVTPDTTFRLQVDYESTTHIVGQLDLRILKASIYRDGAIGKIIDDGIKVGLNEEIQRIGDLESDVKNLKARNPLTDDDELTLAQLNKETRERTSRVPVSEYFYSYNSNGTSPLPNPDGLYTEDQGLIVSTYLFIKGSYANDHRDSITLTKGGVDEGSIGGANGSLTINGVSYFRWDLSIINSNVTLELIVHGSETRLEVLNNQDDLTTRVATDEAELKNLESTLGGLKDIGELVTRVESDETVPVKTSLGDSYGLIDMANSNGSLRPISETILKAHGMSIMRTITTNGALYNLYKSSSSTVPLIRNTSDNRIEVRQEIPATAQTTTVEEQYGSTHTGRTELEIDYSQGNNPNVELEWDRNIEYPALVNGTRKWQYEIKIYLNGNLSSSTTQDLVATTNGANVSANFDLLNFRGDHSLRGEARYSNGGYKLYFIDNGSPYGLSSVRILVKVKYRHSVTTPAAPARVEWLHVADNFNRGGVSCFFQESNRTTLLVGIATTQNNATFVNTGIAYNSNLAVQQVANAGDVILHVRSDSNNMDITPAMLGALPALADLKWAGMYRAMDAHHVTTAFNSQVSGLDANGNTVLLQKGPTRELIWEGFFEHIEGTAARNSLTLPQGKTFEGFDYLIVEGHHALTHLTGEPSAFTDLQTTQWVRYGVNVEFPMISYTSSGGLYRSNFKFTGSTGMFLQEDGGNGQVVALTKIWGFRF